MVLLPQSPRHGDPEEPIDSAEAPRVSEDIPSACSTPYVSAPSSPGRDHAPPTYFFSAPASPVHFVLLSGPSSSTRRKTSEDVSATKYDTSSIEFDFGSRFDGNVSSDVGGSMSSAEELFLNGEIRPMKLSSHLKRPQILSPLIDLEAEDDGDEDRGEQTVTRGRDLSLRSRSVHRKARSLSPLRNAAFHWNEKEEDRTREREVSERIQKLQEDFDETAPSLETTPSWSASSSRSSSTGRNSKRWIFLKDLLYRSKSEGRGNGKEKLWSSISLFPLKEKKPKNLNGENPLPGSDGSNDNASEERKQKQKHQQNPASAKKLPAAGKPTNGVVKRLLPPSAHELHYTANRAQSKEMKKRTYLPYKHGLFGCLGFSSKGYSALNGLARSFNPVSTR